MYRAYTAQVSGCFSFQFLVLRRFRDIWTQYSSSLTTHFFIIAVSKRLILSSINHSALFMFPLIMSYYFHCLDGKQSVFEIMVRSIFNQPNSHVHTEHFEPRPFGKSLPNGLGFIHIWAIVFLAIVFSWARHVILADSIKNCKFVVVHCQANSLKDI